MSNIRKAIVGLLLAAALAFPTGVFAADSSSDTNESLTVASTVSMTAPASATYNLSDFDGVAPLDFGTDLVVTVLSSNNPSGITLTAKVDPFVTGGSISVATNKRATGLTELDCTSPGQVINSVFVCPTTPAPTAASGSPLTKAATTLAKGTFVDNTTVVTIASSLGALANADIGVEFYVTSSDFPVGGTYNSAVHWTTSTNP